MPARRLLLPLLFDWPAPFLTGSMKCSFLCLYLPSWVVRWTFKLRVAFGFRFGFPAVERWPLGCRCAARAAAGTAVVTVEFALGVAALPPLFVHLLSLVS